MAGYRTLLSERSFLPYLFAGAFSFAAPSTVLIVLVWATAVAFPASLPSHTAFSALALALLGLSATIPTLAAAIVSGALADRVDRRRLMQSTNFLAIAGAGALLLVASLRPSGAVHLLGPPGFYLPLWLLLSYPLWALLTTSATLFRPAFNATVPQLLPKAALGRANGLIYGVAVSVSVVGSLLATELITLFNEGTALVVPFGLFVITGAAISLIARRTVRPASSPKTRFATDVSEGYRYLWRNRPLLLLTVSALLVNFISQLAFVELGLYVRDWLGVTEAILLGAMITGATVGSGIGTLLAGRIRFENHAGRYLIGLTALQGVVVMGLALSHSIVSSVALMFVFGICPGMSTTIFLATVQATVPNQLLGRVLAADEVGSYAMVPMGQYAGGLLTLLAGIGSTYLVAGGATVAVGGGMALSSSLRRLGFEPNPDVAKPPGYDDHGLVVAEAVIVE